VEDFVMETDEQLMRRAERRVKDKAGFYIHFACYLVVNIGLFIFFRSIVQDNTNLIPILFGPLFGWGIGIVAHFAAVFLGPTDAAIQKEYKKLKEIKK
jgi:hypothetical protein